MKPQRILYKSHALYSQPSLNVDRQAGTIKNIVIAREGLNKNNTYFTKSFLQQLAAKGQGQKRGVKARFGHPNMCAEALGSYIGRYHNFRVSDDGLYVMADLQLDAICKKTTVQGRSITMWDYILEMAKSNHDSFGNSIVITGSTHAQNQFVAGKLQQVQVQQLNEFIASDLVDDPAATESLFFNAGSLAAATTQFFDNHPEIFGLLEKDEKIILSFLGRYNQYKTLKTQKMNFLQKIKNALSGSFSLNLALADGTTISAITDAQTPKPGDAVADADGIPLADGSYPLSDGSILVVANGVITAINTKTNTDETSRFQTLFSALESRQETLNRENQKVMEMMAEAIAGLQKNYESLAMNTGSAYQVKKDTVASAQFGSSKTTNRILTSKNQ